MAGKTPLQTASQRSRSGAMIDGHCGPVEHSWLRVIGGVLLDVYVPGRLPSVQIIDPLVGVSYRPGPTRRDVDSSGSRPLERVAAWLGAHQVSDTRATISCV